MNCELKRVLVLGGTGMLGSMMVDVLDRMPGLQISATYRRQSNIAMRKLYPNVNWVEFEADSSFEVLTHAVPKPNWIVNAIGITKPCIDERSPASCENALFVNCVFPFRLCRFAIDQGARILQIATDCVYSGRTGRYFESSIQDAHDIYGRSKGLGEAPSAFCSVLRSSIIGPEWKSFVFLFEWLRRQPGNAAVTGFWNHSWNGITTLHFARLCAAIIEQNITLPPLLHVIPGDDISKLELLRLIARFCGRGDIIIRSGAAAVAVNRTLRTEHLEINTILWAAAGYSAPPSIGRMVEELARYNPRFSGLDTQMKETVQVCHG